ncbi:hypothetical protein Q669_32150 [Labrenzia sp. C1B10]|uniref:hypothetical protein n=1 Tax=unclassified Labrenzia TaxID=2648686 RepID=UPI0003B87249|nr:MULTISPECIES: hypothetical protein [unclassified Labrenzia]ERP91134.1 hypothetical protein Q669_32150 [Labrenzia sp. C1B10]ERS06871.1 hypothetical protein Q675_24575 [Labrenzia sp. C1B70]
MFSDTGGVADAAPLHARKNFDTVFLTLSDVVYRDGSIHHAVSGHDYFWLAGGQMMTSMLLLGLVERQKDRRAGICFESTSILAVFTAPIAMHL